MHLDLGQALQEITVSATVQQAIVSAQETVVLAECFEQRVTVSAEENVVVVAARGAPGASGAGIPSIPFAFGDAPRVVWTAASAGLLTYARLVMQTAFNGAPGAITVGALGSPGVVLAASMIDPHSTHEFENTPDIRLAAGDAVILTITPGAGTTVGSGLLLLDFLPD